MERALQLTNQEVYKFRQQFFPQLATADPGQGDFAKVFIHFAKLEGSESAAKRRSAQSSGRIRDTIFEYYLALLAVDNNSGQVYAVLDEAARQSCDYWGKFPQPTALGLCADAIDRTLDF